MKKELIEWGKAFIFAAIVVFIFNIFFGTTTVYSTSMYPTLIEKDIVLLTKLGDPERGDIVSFKSELTIGEESLKLLNPIQKLMVNKDSKKNLIKRVIGLPGDEIKVSNGEVYVNGVLLDEPYISSYTTGDVYIEALGENQYFLMGDNRTVSLDSRSDRVGPVDGNTIFGKVLIRILPFNRMGAVQ
ncbi:MAG: signal peptidase I [Clostridia bacterium]|nr:signal peptidase I [Clostridia bacterium]